jgi:hypothetical protein
MDFACVDQGISRFTCPEHTGINEVVRGGAGDAAGLVWNDELGIAGRVEISLRYTY